MKTLTKSQIVELKTKLTEYVESNGGGFAHVKFHPQCRYAEGFIAVYMNDESGRKNRDIIRVRLYHDGELRCLDARGRSIQRVDIELDAIDADPRESSEYRLNGKKVSQREICKYFGYNV
jgi:hypothetical protein